ncbi:hypothetical protein PQQ65_04905 [Paraburkholderia strydomiana]|uniref:hypothetical protein n=1 Tax=Paraburkholderia strydomiana TaxID=1245417 RepID=UPI0038BCCB7A
MARSSFSITLNRTGLDAAIDDNINRQLPFIVSKALNDTAKNARDALRTAMPQYFDRPTPYTMNSVRITYATKARLAATVGYKDESFKGTPATKYLLPEVEGGNRNVKRMEQSLRRIGLLPVDMYLVPGSAARLDQYGNVWRGQVVEVLAYLQAFGEQGYRANMTSKRRDRLARGVKGAMGYSYFVLPRREGKLLPGIYRRQHYGNDARIAHLAHGAAKPVFIFVRTPHYAQRFPFDTIVGNAVSSNLDSNTAAAFALAVSTPKR